MNDGYRYALAFRRADGSSAGQVPVTVDWEPAREFARFKAFRQRGLASRSLAELRVEPIWNGTMGEPYVDGVRVRTDTLGAEPLAETVASECTLEYFGGLVQPAVERLVDQKRAQPGETLTYHVVAFPRQQKEGVPPLFDSEEVISAPVCRQTKLGTFLRDSLAMDVGDGVQDDVFVFLRPMVIRETSALAEQAGAIETGGILVGYLHQDVGNGGLFVEVTAQIPACGEGSSTSLTFTAQTWTDVRAALDLRGRDELKRFSNRPCTTCGGRGTSARTDAGGPMRAYSMDLRERALLDSDAGMKAADVAAKYRVSGSWVRRLKQRRRARAASRPATGTARA